MTTARTGTDYLLSHVARYIVRFNFTVNNLRTEETTRGTKEELLRHFRRTHKPTAPTNCHISPYRSISTL